MVPISRCENLLSAKIVGFTKLSSDFVGGDDLKSLVAYCGRVSNPANQDNVDTYDKLIRYLIRKRHWSPFEMVSLTLEISCPRDIARQILRHRSFSFQEFSQRYADPTKALDHPFCFREARLQDEKNRQASTTCEDPEKIEAWEKAQTEVIYTALRAYEAAIKAGIAKEVARVVLPEGLTMSRMYMQGTLRSWIHYLQTRLEEGTQKEHREIAKCIAIAIAMPEIFPELAIAINPSP